MIRRPPRSTLFPTRRSSDLELGISGAAVQAIGPSGTLNTTTDSNGAYHFTNLTPGTYAVTFTTPAGYAAASPALQGGDTTLDSNGTSTSVTLISGQDDKTIDSGFYKLASFGDFVWNDTNANGIQDAGELGISGAAVQAIGPSGTLNTTTDSNGAYHFNRKSPRPYSVTLPTPADDLAFEQPLRSA